MSEVSLGNLYEINKNLMKERNPLSRFALDKRIKEVKSYFGNNKMYFMLLCNERADYTIFRLTKENSCIEASEIFEECLFNRGEILEIERTEDKYAFEVWLRINNDVYCYYLFPYDEAIIEC